MQQAFYDILYYIYIMLFGAYCAMRLACGSLARKHWRLLAFLCPVLLLGQGILLEFLGMEGIWRLYPLIVHLPIALAFILFLRVKWDAALLSVIISYSLCQLMRWVGLVVDMLFRRPVASLIIHLSLCLLLFFLLDRYCLSSIHKVFCRSEKLFRVFGALPVLYYIHEYFMLYTQQRFEEILAFRELLPTAMLLFFTLFIIVYQRESEKCGMAEQQRFMFEMELEHAKREIDTLHVVQERTAIYRHDMRHHLSMISSLLAANRTEQAAEYIYKISGEIENIAPCRYCENDTVNLLLGSFQEKAEERGIIMDIKATLPAQLCLNDTELCVILSNGLENALNAVASLPEGGDRKISLYIGSNRNKLLIEIRNPYTGDVILQNGVPVAQDPEQHYGCRSILSVVQRRNGICTFDAKEGVFLLQIAIPLA